jgi:hypothetical protein
MEEIRVQQIRSHRPLFTPVKREQRSDLVTYNTEMHVFIQLAKDRMVEIANTDALKPYRYEVMMANEAFAGFRRKLRRTVGAAECDQFDSLVCDIADMSDEDLAWVRSMLRTQMVNKVRYDQIDAAILIGITGGFIDMSRKLYRLLFGKSSTDLDTVYRYLKMIDNGMEFSRVNEAVDPDFAPCLEAMEKMFQRVRGRIIHATGAGPAAPA